MDGRAAEDLVARWLRIRGRPILARNFRTRAGEIDVVALDGAVVCVVEVRSRAAGSRVAPLESVDARKRRRVELAAHAFLRRQGLEDRPLRFDVASVVEGLVDYVEDAW